MNKTSTVSGFKITTKYTGVKTLGIEQNTYHMIENWVNDDLVQTDFKDVKPSDLSLGIAHQNFKSIFININTVIAIERIKG